MTRHQGGKKASSTTGKVCQCYMGDSQIRTKIQKALHGKKKLPENRKEMSSRKPISGKVFT